MRLAPNPTRLKQQIRIVIAARQRPGELIVEDVPALDEERPPLLDAYLAAHKQFAGTTALAMPTASLRAAPADAPAR